MAGEKNDPQRQLRGHEGPEPDPALVARAARGDDAALDALARELWPRIRRWALLELADPQAAEDACQDALVRLIRHLHTYEPGRGPFVPWLRALVRNAARDQRRVLVLPLTDRIGSGGPGRTVDLRRSAARAMAAFRKLTPRQRYLVDLCDWQGVSVVDAAEAMGISPSTVRVHLHGGRQRLRELLGPDVRDLVRGEGR